MKMNTLKMEPKVLLIRMAGFTLIAILAYSIITTSLHGLRYFIHYPDSATTSQWLLLPHIETGFMALMIGPGQFWQGFRQRYLQVHRWMSRIYLNVVAISSLLGLYMAFTYDNLIVSTGITGLRLAWIVTGTREKLYISHVKACQVIVARSSALEYPSEVANPSTRTFHYYSL